MNLSSRGRKSRGSGGKKKAGADDRGGLGSKIKGRRGKRGKKRARVTLGGVFSWGSQAESAGYRGRIQEPVRGNNGYSTRHGRPVLLLRLRKEGKEECLRRATHNPTSNNLNSTSKKFKEQGKKLGNKYIRRDGGVKKRRSNREGGFLSPQRTWVYMRNRHQRLASCTGVGKSGREKIGGRGT